MGTVHRVQTIEFTTPQHSRAPQPVTVDWCGSHWTIQRPKDAILLFASTATSTQVPDQDRALAVLQFFRGTLADVQLKEFHDRIKDERDPVDEPEVTELVAALYERWSGEPDSAEYDDSAVTIAIQSARPEQPVTTRVVSQDRLDELDADERESVDLVAPMDLELDMLFTRPKSFVTRIVHSGIGTQAGIGDQAWSIGFLLDAALSAQDAAHVQTRWASSDPDDLLDIRPMADIVTALLAGWGEQDRNNRAQRREQARTPKKRPGNPGGNKSRKTSSSTA